MQKDAAIQWVRANCPTRQVSWDVKAALEDADAAGANCWFVIGSRMTKGRVPYFIHCFAGEVFIFQLTEAQAKATGVHPMGMGKHRETRPDPIPAAPPPVISLERFELRDTALTQTMPIVGRLHYEVLADGGGPWCVRLDYDLPGGRRVAWDMPERTLWGKGTIDVQFLPIAPTPDIATKYRGPLVLFARLFEMSPPELTHTRRPISTVCAALVDLL